MSRFFFHVEDGQSFPDDVGTELEGIRQAQLSAVKLAANLLEEETLFWRGEQWSMRVKDEEGITLFVLSFTASDRESLAKGKH